jgi:CubicO group peptidase (beta-lactamase class C family)
LEAIHILHMNWKMKYSILGIALWLLFFLAWEWWRSYPKVKLTPISFPESREARIDSLLVQSLSNGLIPGIAVCIVEDQRVTYLKAYGYQNLEAKEPLTLESPMPLASVSKLFTALSLANFALENGISIDTAFNSLLPKNKRLPAEFDRITLRDLLNHTSGISDEGWIQQILRGAEKKKLSNISRTVSLLPGVKKEFQYADANFDLIGYVLESRAKVPFESLMKENMLATGGMEQSYFLTRNATDSLPTLGYKHTFLWKRLETVHLKLERYPSPSSGLVSSPRDLSRAMLYLCRGGMGIFGDELKWLQGGSHSPAGFQKITINQSEFFGHFGGSGGFSALVLYSPTTDTGLFLLANARDESDFRSQISDKILHLLNP